MCFRFNPQKRTEPNELQLGAGISGDSADLQQLSLSLSLFELCSKLESTRRVIPSILLPLV